MSYTACLTILSSLSILNTFLGWELNRCDDRLLEFQRLVIYPKIEIMGHIVFLVI